MNYVSVIFSTMALVGVLLLGFLQFRQYEASREMRVMILNDQADTALNNHEADAALKLLAQIHELNPNTPGIWRRIAIAYMMAGQHREAATAAQGHLSENPGDIGISALLGAAQIMTKDYDGAERTLVSALQLAPNQRDLVQNLSELRRLQRRPGDAARLIDQYLAQNPNDGFFQYKRAMAEVAGELPDTRRRDIAAAIADGKASAGIYVVAAAMDFRDGKPDAARQKLEEGRRRSTEQDMRIMLEDEFFHDHLTFTQPATEPAPSPSMRL